MEINVSRKHYEGHPAAAQLFAILERFETDLNLTAAQLYYKFPLYKDPDGGIIESRILLASPRHGLLILWTIDDAPANVAIALKEAITHADQIYSLIYSRLIRNKNLRKGRDLCVKINVAIYAPYVNGNFPLDLKTEILTRDQDVNKFIEENEDEPIEDLTFSELISTLEGAKGLIRPKARDISSLSEGSKGALAARQEAEISRFDKQQKYAYTSILDGVQRVRGLAGSGKTVLLAMKAALTHLRYPEANLAFTFYTKSLYQHVQRLITRFYREFDDKDPDWNKVQILHAWGGASMPGLYSIACKAHNVSQLSYTEATNRTLDNPFSFACEDLFNKASTIKPIFDFIFIDEGQDFPVSFVRLCRSLAMDERVLWAYDDLQTIFQATTPTASDVFGRKPDGSPAADFTEDIILYKCYRNPKEVLVCAHALGFGFYGKRIVQMLENRDHWEDIGYKIISGEMVEDSIVTVERIAENSPMSLSSSLNIDDMVQTIVCKDKNEEVEKVSSSIAKDIEDGLRPDDILVIVVDDYNAKGYMSMLSATLANYKIKCNDVHSDTFNLRDFFIEDHVTLSTVYKAKGNEAFMVYIVGVDHLFGKPNIRTRNILFTAMTRAKGWVRISGVGEEAEECSTEIAEAKKNFPKLIFRYPGAGELKVMKRDLQRAAIEKQRLERLLDELLTKMSPEEASAYIQQRASSFRRTRKKITKKRS